MEYPHLSIVSAQLFEVEKPEFRNKNKVKSNFLMAIQEASSRGSPAGILLNTCLLNLPQLLHSFISHVFPKNDKIEEKLKCTFKILVFSSTQFSFLSLFLNIYATKLFKYISKCKELLVSSFFLFKLSLMSVTRTPVLLQPRLEVLCPRLVPFQTFP